MNVLSGIAFIFAVFGLYEFIDWYSGNNGLLGNLILENWEIDFFLLQNPFISLYLLLPLAWTDSVRTEIREGILARSPLMFNEWIPKLFWFLQGLGYFTLVYQLRYLFGGFSQGYELNSHNFGGTFFSILLLVFLIQFIFRNLPEINTIKEPQLVVLDKDEVGLYALDQQQFALEDIVGVTHHLNVLIGATRTYKDKNKVWFIFKRFSNQINQEYLTTNIGSLAVSYSYFVNVTNDPKTINLDQVELAGIESDEQLNLKIKQDFNQVFNQDIYQQQEYQELENLIHSYLSNCFMMTNSLGAVMEQAIKLEIVRLSIDQVNHKLTAFDGNFSLYGGLYQIRTCIHKISLESELKQRLEDVETRLRECINQDYERTKDEREVAVELVNNIGKWDGLLPNDDMTNIISLVLQNIIPASLKNNNPEFESTLWENIPKQVINNHNQQNLKSYLPKIDSKREITTPILPKNNSNSLTNNDDKIEPKSFGEKLAEENSQKNNGYFDSNIWNSSQY